MPGFNQSSAWQEPHPKQHFTVGWLQCVGILHGMGWLKWVSRESSSFYFLSVCFVVYVNLRLVFHSGFLGILPSVIQLPLCIWILPAALYKFRQERHNLLSYNNSNLVTDEFIPWFPICFYKTSSELAYDLFICHCAISFLLNTTKEWEDWPCVGFEMVARIANSNIYKHKF